MDSVDVYHVDSLDNDHGQSGQWPWTVWTMTMDSLDNDHGQSGLWQWTVWTMTMYRLDYDHGQSGLWPWTVWTMTMDSLDNDHGQFGLWPWTLWTKSSESIDKVQWDQSDWTISTLFVQRFQELSGQSGHCAWTKNKVSGVQVDWTKSMDSLDFVQSDVVKKT